MASPLGRLSTEHSGPCRQEFSRLVIPGSASTHGRAFADQICPQTSGFTGVLADVEPKVLVNMTFPRWLRAKLRIGTLSNDEAMIGLVGGLLLKWNDE